MAQAERTELARRMDSYTVYDNKTDKIIACGTFTEVEDYVENPGRYTVVHDYSGYTVGEQVGTQYLATDHGPQLPYLARRARLQKKKVCKIVKKA